jgi:threonine dehydrogenase-like Zn-dependent dehydrogenase
MSAIAVVPGKPDSVHLAELAKPSIDEVPGGRGVLVKVLRVGVDGTDKEINAAEYGAAPDGHQFLVIGHEGFGRVEAVGDNVTEVRPGDYVVATVRRPGTSLYDLIGTNDMTTDDTYFERGINLRHGYLTEYYVADAGFILKVPRACARSACSSSRDGPPRSRYSRWCSSRRHYAAMSTCCRPGCPTRPRSRFLPRWLLWRSPGGTRCGCASSAR